MRRSVLRNVEADSISEAIALADWFKHEADRFYASCTMSERERQLIEYAHWIRRKYPEGAEVREFQGGFRDIKTDAEQILIEIKREKLGAWVIKEDGKRAFKSF